MSLGPGAFLGLGAIGAPMAARLARGARLTVWNRTRTRAEAFARAHGARDAATPREAVEGADVVVTCLPTSREVEALARMVPTVSSRASRSGALFIDCTSGDPAGSRRIAARLAERGVAYADAPVSGGTNGAEAGTAHRSWWVRMTPRPSTGLARCSALMGSRIVHVGPIGAGDAHEGGQQRAAGA